MKNNMIANVVAVILLIAIAGMLTYFYVSLNRMDKKITDVQATMVETSGAVNEIVNFFNTNINAQQNN